MPEPWPLVLLVLVSYLMFIMDCGQLLALNGTDPFMWGGEEEEEEEAAKGTSEGPGEAMRCVEWLCGFTASHSVLADLLKERSIEGYTPFMAATAYKVWTFLQTV